MKDKVLSLEGQLKISEDKCSQLQDQVIEVKREVYNYFKETNFINVIRIYHSVKACFPILFSSIFTT